MINNNGNTVTKTRNVNDNFRKTYSNLNITNIKSYEADEYSVINIPENALNNSFLNGDGSNWYGGTKSLYYSEDDTLTLESNLLKFKSLTIEANKKIILPEPIKSKRFLLVKDTKNSVYEFQCLGNS